MAIIKCKMCGGDIPLSAGLTCSVCDHCGSTVTLPAVSGEQRADAFDRGNHFRRMGEFDKALQVYERLVSEAPDDAEAHWCCALCRFGILYEEDPAAYEYVPVCHRVGTTGFTEDADYLAAVRNASGPAQKQYLKEGARIAEIQRSIRLISQSEAPFDVSLCRKGSEAADKHFSVHEQAYPLQEGPEEVKAEKGPECRPAEEGPSAKKPRIQKIKITAAKIVVAAVAVVCAVAAFIFAYNSVIMPSAKYKLALSVIEEGHTVDGYEILLSLNGYKDSAEKARELFDRYMAEKLKNAAAGDTLFFGTYEQDNNLFNGKEAILWQVLAVKDGKALIVSQYALDCQSCHSSDTAASWENSAIRSRLNEAFLQDAFSAEEQAMIALSDVKADRNSQYDTDPGNATKDKIFLLSTAEAEMYFSANEARMCEPTAYAKAQGAVTDDGHKTANGRPACRWWLRSPGNDPSHAACILCDGSTDQSGSELTLDGIALRPALWIGANN